MKTKIFVIIIMINGACEDVITVKDEALADAIYIRKTNEMFGTEFTELNELEDAKEEGRFECSGQKILYHETYTED